jgi:hypothetical protein
MPRFAYAVGIWRTANPEPDLENMFCATPFGDSLRINEGKTNEKVLALSWFLLVVVLCCVIRVLVTRRHSRRETTGWISKRNRVFSGRRVVKLELGPVAIDCHGSGVAIDRDGDLLARVARVGEGKPGLQFVAAAASGLAAHLKGNQVSAWNAAPLVHCPH